MPVDRAAAEAVRWRSASAAAGCASDTSAAPNCARVPRSARWRCRGCRTAGPAMICARSDGRMSLTLSIRQSRLSRDLPGADERQVISFVQAAEEVGLLQLDAEKGTLNTAHDRHRAVVLGDVVVVADDLPADGEPGQHDEDQDRGGDDHLAPGARRLGDLFRLRHNTFGFVAARIEGRRASRGGVGRGGLVVVTGYRTREDRLRLPVVVVDDVGDDHRDVVGSAAAQREFDEPVGTFGHIRDLQGVEDRLVADRIGQPVGAQQVAVARPGLPA